ncbi:hypothetical protein [Actinoplanes sp. NPDC026623]|uniref:hypothetical protein n=1 Tax=Actinoplanes sp. NPDC026623 TaxID=3155610 RepID=UPI00340E1325
MTERAIAPGSGARVRRAYSLYLLIAAVTVVLVLVIVVGSALAATEGGPLLTVVFGATAAIIASLLLVASLLRGRAAVAADTLSVPAMRSSGALARAAQVAGCAGAAGALILGFLQHLSDIELAFTIGVVTATCAAVPAVLSGAARRLCRRLTQ